MRNFKIVYILIAVAMLGAACTQAPVDDGMMHIRGAVSGATAGDEIYLQIFDGTAPVDTAIIAADGAFEFITEPSRKDFYKIFIDAGIQPIILVFDSLDTNIRVEADRADLSGTYSVTGSKDSELIKDFIVRVTTFQASADSVKATASTMDPAQQQAVNSQLMTMQQGFESDMKKMATENATSPAALSIISSIDINGALPEYKTVFAALSKTMSHSKFVEAMGQQIVKTETAKRMENGMLGQAAPEIDLQNPEGKYVALSDFKGKYVLIDFWASWCGPCRRENPNVVKLYEKYGGDKFEILGVSLDSDKKRWMQAIEQDGLKWPHVSDLKKWSSAPAADYGVRSIPFTALVDPDGNIIATKLRGAALERKLEELLGA